MNSWYQNANLLNALLLNDVNFRRLKDCSFPLHKQKLIQKFKLHNPGSISFNCFRVDKYIVVNRRHWISKRKWWKFFFNFNTHSTFWCWKMYKSQPKDQYYNVHTFRFHVVENKKFLIFFAVGANFIFRISFSLFFYVFWGLCVNNDT